MAEYKKSFEEYITHLKKEINVKEYITCLKEKINKVIDVVSLEEKDRNLYVHVSDIEEPLVISYAFDESGIPDMKKIAEELANSYIAKRTVTDPEARYQIREALTKELVPEEGDLEKKIKGKEKVVVSAVAAILFFGTILLFAFEGETITTYVAAYISDTETIPFIFILAAILLALTLFFLFFKNKNKRLEDFCRKEFKRIYKREPKKEELKNFIENMKKAGEKV